MAEGGSKKVNKNTSPANSVAKENDEAESVADTIEDYSDEGYEDEDEEYDENSKERRVRFKVGSLYVKNKLSTCTLHYFQFLLFLFINTLKSTQLFDTHMTFHDELNFFLLLDRFFPFHCLANPCLSFRQRRRCRRRRRRWSW